MGPSRIHALGVLKTGPCFQLFCDYQKRMKYPPQLIEHTLKPVHGLDVSKAESEAILKALRPQDALIALDEKGHTLTTQQFYHRVLEIQENNKIPCFAIGGANGHHDTLKQQAHTLISFGLMTWPHMMARAMLMEQLYRLQQIHINHPYHRD